MLFNKRLWQKIFQYQIRGEKTGHKFGPYLGPRALEALLLRFFYKFPSTVPATDLHHWKIIQQEVEFNQHFRNSLMHQWTNKQQTSKANSSSIYRIDYARGREPVAREPDVALLMTASVSLHLTRLLRMKLFL